MKETVQMLVTVRLAYSTPKARRDAIKEVRDSLGCAIYTAGDDAFSVKTGRVVLHKPAAKRGEA